MVVVFAAYMSDLPDTEKLREPIDSENYYQRHADEETAHCS